MMQQVWQFLKKCVPKFVVLEMAERNTLDAISFVQTAEGALSSTHSILQRMRELAVQAANDSNTEVDRDAIQQEINQLTNEVNRIANTTEFNTKKLLNGSLYGVKTTSAQLTRWKLRIEAYCSIL